MERRQDAWRHSAVRAGGVLACGLALLLGGCGTPEPEAAATWRVSGGHQVGPDTTSFTAMVSRLGCNNGVTGDVHAPEISVEDERVVVTFSVDPIEGDASCPGNDEVSYEVVLPEPLGDRRLVDGQCESGGEASDTTFCEPDGVRYSPD